jgi:hypothetical protein
MFVKLEINIVQENSAENVVGLNVCVLCVRNLQRVKIAPEIDNPRHTIIKQ